jgi:hypothetical protein
VINERVPLPSELKQILAKTSSLKARTADSLTAFLGVRISTLGDKRGDNGLEIRDFPEMQIKDRKITFTKIPTRVIIRKPISKTWRQYENFLNPEGCEILGTYLQSRLNNKEELDSLTPILPVDYTGAGTAGAHMTSKTISENPK